MKDTCEKKCVTELSHILDDFALPIACPRIPVPAAPQGSPPAGLRAGRWYRSAWRLADSCFKSLSSCVTSQAFQAEGCGREGSFEWALRRGHWNRVQSDEPSGGGGHRTPMNLPGVYTEGRTDTRDPGNAKGAFRPPSTHLAPALPTSVRTWPGRTSSTSVHTPCSNRASFRADHMPRGPIRQRHPCAPAYRRASVW